MLLIGLSNIPLSHNERQVAKPAFFAIPQKTML